MAERAAIRIAEDFWKNHERMKVNLVGLDELVFLLKKQSKGTIALVDAADATSSGASGDSNAILRKLLEIEYSGKTLLPIVDKHAVNKAIAIGVGGIFKTFIGGTLDSKRFKPLLITAKVTLISDGYFQSESFGENWYSGLTAVLESSNFTIVVSSRAVNLYDRSFFYAHGQDPKKFDLVVVKSPHCQHHIYADWCEMMINIDAPGSSSANLHSLGHTRCPRPIFPLDNNVHFRPLVKLFKSPNSQI
jgi:microcystin degradation protein MlrC